VLCVSGNVLMFSSCSDQMVLQVVLYWSVRSACTTLGSCKQNLLATMNSVFHFEQATPFGQKYSDQMVLPAVFVGNILTRWCCRLCLLKYAVKIVL
jgi:hypothetical protein